MVIFVLVDYSNLCVMSRVFYFFVPCRSGFAYVRPLSYYDSLASQALAKGASRKVLVGGFHTPSRRRLTDDDFSCWVAPNIAKIVW